MPRSTKNISNQVRQKVVSDGLIKNNPNRAQPKIDPTKITPKCHDQGQRKQPYSSLTKNISGQGQTKIIIAEIS